MRKNIFYGVLVISLSAALIGCSSTKHFFSKKDATPAPVTSQSLTDNSAWQGNSITIWERLQSTPQSELRSTLATTHDATTQGWIQLALISKQYSLNTPELIQQLKMWRQKNPNHPGSELFPNDTTLDSISTTPPQHIALLLPLQGQYAAQGKAIRDGFMRAYYAKSKNGVKQSLTFIDTNQTPDMTAAYQQAVQKGADFVIGPLTKENVQQLMKNNAFTAPVLALNYADAASPNNFYQFGLSALDEAQQIADKAYQSGRSKAIIIAPNSDWGQRTAKAIAVRWQNDGGQVIDSLNFNSDTDFNTAIPALLHINAKNDRELMKKDNNKKILAEQRRQDFDVIFLLAQPKEARQIVPLLHFYYAGDIPVYASSVVYSGRSNPEKDVDLNGVTFCDIPWIIKGNTNKSRLFAIGNDSYLISDQLQRLTTLQNFPLYAATGALTITPDRQIYRRLPWATFHNGRV